MWNKIKPDHVTSLCTMLPECPCTIKETRTIAQQYLENAADILASMAEKYHQWKTRFTVSVSKAFIKHSR